MLAKCLLLTWLAAGALSLPAVPTADPMVVTRLDGDNPAAVTEAGPTTEAPVPPLKLTEMDVRSEVSMRYARTAVVTHVRNPANRSQEAVFRVLLPETAYISGFEMTLDGVAYKAYVKGKEEAKQIYDQAVSQGVGAAHVAVKARDSNEFILNVNVEANVKAKFNLTYEELLERRNGVYNHDINLLPGALVPALTVTVHVREAQEITTLRVPELRTGNEVDPTDSDPLNTGAVIERSADNREATITFKPDLEEQKRLMQVYEEKSKQTQQVTRRYRNENNNNAKEGVLGQFVVQYDVKRPTKGDILVNDGYFVHFFAPEDLPPLVKLVVFVLDTSGSMMDRKIEQLRQAMRTIVDQLNPNDYFSIVEFNSGVKVHDLKEADEEPPKKSNNYYPFYGLNDNNPVTLVPPFSATKENIEKAKVIVSRLLASGGTNIASALDVAINIAQKGVVRPLAPGETGPTGATGPTAETGETAATAPTGGAGEPDPTDAPPAAFPTPEPQQPDDNEEKQELENMIVFLTDGEPTVGDTSPRGIISRTSERNIGPRRAAIYSLAFGEDADRSFLRKLSLRNSGFMRHIYEAADAALQIGDFYRQISSPLLADVTFSYPPDQVKEASLTKRKFRTYYAGSEVVVAGRIEPTAAELTPTVEGYCGVDDGVGKKRYEVFPRVPVARAPGAWFPLERLWVYLTIRQLLDQKDAADAAAAGAPAAGAPAAGAPAAGAPAAGAPAAGAPAAPPATEDPEAKAKALALQYELVTPLTSLVVVKPNATNAVDAQSVDAPNRPVFSSSVPLAANGLSFASGAGGSPLAFSSLASAPAADSIQLQPEQDFVDYSDYGFGRPVMRLSSGSVQRLRPVSHHSYPSSSSYSTMLSTSHRSSYLSSEKGGAVGPSVVGRPISGQPGQHGPPGVGGQAPASTPVAPPAPAAPAADPLALYHLENYPWTRALISPNSDQLTLYVNGTTVTYKITKTDNAPRGAHDAACARATDGGAGACVYLTRCAPAQALTAAAYADVRCAVDVSAADEGYAGVCCPAGGVAA